MSRSVSKIHPCCLVQLRQGAHGTRPPGGTGGPSSPRQPIPENENPFQDMVRSQHAPQWSQLEGPVFDPCSEATHGTPRPSRNADPSDTKKHPARSALVAYRDDRLDEAASLQVRAHLDACAPCRAEFLNNLSF